MHVSVHRQARIAHPGVTLALCAMLHAFTHAMASLLVPLYLLIVRDLHLPGVRSASLIVTVYSLVYCLGSYAAGVLADHANRKWLLGIGLIGNSLAIGAMGVMHNYSALLVLGGVAGLFGTLFHPSANALVPALFPKNPGMVIGLLGAGSGVGFFVGPRFAGWRASQHAWELPGLSSWQWPCVEMGAFGVLAGIIFLIVAREVSGRFSGERPPGEAILPARPSVEAIVTDLRASPPAHGRALPPRMRRRVLVIAAILGWRDFAGVASLTLASIYLQHALRYSVERAGMVVGSMMLIGVLANPLGVFISSGRRRLPVLAISLLLGGLAIASVPLLPAVAVLPMLSVFQAFQLGGYSISDAAMLERVGPASRGRVAGLFLVLAGTIASTSPWLMGAWTDRLGARASEPMAYLPIFITLGLMMWIATGATPLIGRLGAGHGGEIR